MRKMLAGIPVLALAVAFIASGQQPKAPASFTIPAKNGAILFDHASHGKHDDCKSCHPDPWPQNRTAPINFRAPHSTSVSKQLSCGKCHRPQGTAFAANQPANCKKCHGTAPKA
ncbi:MAG: cytochrome c3 family protein [bacterium]|jgi:c(7)-type cytochrome triheme protein